VLNDLVASAITTGQGVVMGDGRPWRPVVHVDDVAASFAHVLTAPVEAVHNQAFNNGAEHLNAPVGELARLAAAAAGGGCRVEVRGDPSADSRTYKADFTKFAGTFPDFRFRWSPAEGAKELAAGYRRAGLTHEHYTDPRFTRLRWLNHLRETGRLDGALRWAAPVGAP
ncbi:MAG: NAD-dependent epimerase/dehydratase family protein, partial [Acidimicrobiales bacterium]